MNVPAPMLEPRLLPIPGGWDNAADLRSLISQGEGQGRGEGLE